MEYKLIENTYVVRLDVGDEIMESLTKLCKNENIQAATVQGLGATNNVTVGYYSTVVKKYFPKTFNQQFEIISLNKLKQVFLIVVATYLKAGLI